MFVAHDWPISVGLAQYHGARVGLVKQPWGLLVLQENGLAATRRDQSFAANNSNQQPTTTTTLTTERVMSSVELNLSLPFRDVFKL